MLRLAESAGICRHDAEQLSHSMDWFDEKPDHTCSATPVLIHNTNALHEHASARPGARVITFDKLAKPREAVSKIRRGASGRQRLLERRQDQHPTGDFGPQQQVIRPEAGSGAAQALTVQPAFRS
jgi:hypothetical protein